MNTKRQKIRKTIIFISFALFPITFFYFSPYIIIFASQQGIINGSFIVFSLMFLFSLLFGRLWCGWLCPGAGLEEACFSFQKKRASSKVDKIKYFIWAIWVGIIAWMAIGAGGYKKIDFFLMTKHGVSLTDQHSLNVFLIVMTAILIITFFVGRRGFCHSACWMAPFMIIGDKLGRILKLPSLKLEADKNKCTSCSICTHNCPMSLEVNNMVTGDKMHNLECILCGTCIDSCPRKVIRYRFK